MMKQHPNTDHPDACHLPAHIVNSAHHDSGVAKNCCMIVRLAWQVHLGSETLVGVMSWGVASYYG